MKSLLAFALLATGMMLTGCGALYEHPTDEMPANTVDCDNANGNPQLCTVEAGKGK